MKTVLLSRRSLVGGLASLLSVAGAVGPVPALAGPDEIRIAFVGDSLSDGMWGGAVRLLSREACLGSRIKLGRHAENGTGLTRPAKFDWVAESRAVVARAKPNLVVVSLGLNDRQSIVDTSRARFDLGTPAWRSRYAELSQAMLRNLAAEGAGVLWIGLPVLRDKVSQDDATEKNAVYAEAIKGLGNPKVRYVEPWKQAASGADVFQPYGPDLKGAQVQIRAPDGIHFTAAGYDVLAAYLLRTVTGVLKEQGVAVGYPCQHQAML